MPTTYDANGNPVDDGPSWQDIREGVTADETGAIEIDEQTGNPAITVTVTPKGSNVLGLAFLAAALYFLMSGSDD